MSDNVDNDTHVYTCMSNFVKIELIFEKSAIVVTKALQTYPKSMAHEPHTHIPLMNMNLEPIFVI